MATLRSRRTGARGAVLVLLAALAATSATDPGVAAAAGAARTGSPTLPLGEEDLVEIRTVETLAPGVTLTRIRRGTTPARPEDIGSTQRGPWRVDVITIDRAQATGHLRATIGPDLARTEPTTELARLSGALAAVNASFFDLGALHPGDPVGLGLYGGRLLSNPASPRVAPHESDLLLDARSNRLSFGPHTWTGRVVNLRTGRALLLAELNRAPAVPDACRRMTDQTRCRRPGSVSRFTADFGARSPSGPGVEVVLDRRGCVLRTTRTRGAGLDRGQWSLQATGRATRRLLRVRAGGCLRASVRLLSAGGRRVELHPWTFGVNGRYRLVADGVVRVPTGAGPFHDRNPRTVVGTTGTGRILLVTIDGRRTTSVGASLEETAAVVQALGLRDAVNLDGGGSTTMVAGGALVNQPSGEVERPVGDALVYLEAPFS